MQVMLRKAHQMGTCTTRMKMMGFGLMGSKMVSKEWLCQGCNLYDVLSSERNEIPFQELVVVFKFKSRGHTGDDLAQPSTLNWDENSTHESDGDWSDGRQDGECRLLVLSCFPL
jgi:hypothetical protein